MRIHFNVVRRIRDRNGACLDGGRISESGSPFHGGTFRLRRTSRDLSFQRSAVRAVLSSVFQNDERRLNGDEHTRSVKRCFVSAFRN